MCSILLTNEKKIFKLCTHLNGYHVLLKLQDHLLSYINLKSQQPNISNSIETTNKLYISDEKILDLDLMNDKSIEKIIFNIVPKTNDPLNIDYIIGVVGERFEEICYNENGCCYIQRTLDSCINLPFGKMIIHQLLLNINDFIEHTYSNFIFQYIIEKQIYKYNHYIYQKIQFNLVHLSNGKYSSKVIEKLIEKHISKDEKLLKHFLFGKDVIKSLVLNRYGNYGKNYIY